MSGGSSLLLSAVMVENVAVFILFHFNGSNYRGTAPNKFSLSVDRHEIILPLPQCDTNLPLEYL